MPATLRCFVAMAFGHKDTDAIYSVIRRALKPHIRTLRVDRIEHNDNIDTKIIKELEAADLVVADLTYARPSVYFEAGYAQRKIPVIYTARRDHLKEHPDDVYGNRHVHFDLKMRNIIEWSSPHDKRFAPRLKRRVSKVIAPLVREKKRDAERAQLATTFDHLSQQHKRDWLIGTARDHFEELGYAVTDLRDTGGDKPHVDYELRSGLAAIKQRGQTFRFVFFNVVPRVTARVFDAYRHSLMFRPFYDLRLLEPPRVVPKDIYEDIIVCSLQARSLHRLRSELTMLRVGETEGTLRYDVEHRFRRPGQDDVIATRHMTFHVLETSAKLAMLPDFLKERFSRVANLLPRQSSYIHKQPEPLVIRPMRIVVVRARRS